MKKTSLFKIFLFASALMFSSCEQITWVFLGDGYKYLNEYTHIFDVSGYPGDAIYYVATPLIFPKIEEYKFDENYITVKQRYDRQYSSALFLTVLFLEYMGEINTDIFPIYDSIMYDAFEKYYGIERTSMRAQAFCDSIVDSNPYFKEMEKNDYNYYIIDKANIIKYGPLSKDEFAIKFKEMDLSSSLWISK